MYYASKSSFGYDKAGERACGSGCFGGDMFYLRCPNPFCFDLPKAGKY